MFIAPEKLKIFHMEEWDMRSKVTLKETVGTKIIYALLLVCYYWMWARRDWHNYYETIQNTLAIFTVVFFSLRAVPSISTAKRRRTSWQFKICAESMQSD